MDLNLKYKQEMLPKNRAGSLGAISGQEVWYYAWYEKDLRRYVQGQGYPGIRQGSEDDPLDRFGLRRPPQPNPPMAGSSIDRPAGGVFLLSAAGGRIARRAGGRAISSDWSTTGRGRVA